MNHTYLTDPLFRRMRLVLCAVAGTTWVSMLVPGCAESPPPIPSETELRHTASVYLQRAVHYPENPGVRAQAMEAAAEVLEHEASLLIREGLRDEHPAVRFAACMAVGKIRDTDALAGVRELAHDPDPNVRVGVFFAMERMGDYRYRTAWRDTLRHHEDAAVRRNAALALGYLENKAVCPLLQAAASKDRDEGVRLQALEALALLGDPEAVNRFMYEAFGGLGYKQPFALLTLGRLPDQRAVPALRSRLETAPYLEAKLAAARGLGMQGFDDGYEIAVKALSWNEPDPELPDDPPINQIMRVRTMAAMALGDIGKPQALGWLKETMENPEDPRVQLASATAILKILNNTGTTASTVIE